MTKNASVSKNLHKHSRFFVHYKHTIEKSFLLKLVKNIINVSGKERQHPSVKRLGALVEVLLHSFCSVQRVNDNSLREHTFPALCKARFDTVSLIVSFGDIEFHNDAALLKINIAERRRERFIENA